MPRANPSDAKVSSGELNRPLEFLTVNPALDAIGGVVDPAAEAANPVHAFDSFGGILPYQGLQLIDALSKIGEQWAIIVIRYTPSRLATEGMRVRDKWTGDEYEVTGVLPTASRRQRVELTCRKLV